MGEGEAPEPEAPPTQPARAPEGVTTWFRKRRSWLVLGRTLGGFGAFIAAIVAVLQLVTGGDKPTVTGVAQPLSTVPLSLKAPGPAQEYAFGLVTDRTGKVRVEVPTAWGQVLGLGFIARGLDPAIEGRRLGPGLNAAPNVDAWRRDQVTPGVFIGVSKSILRYFTPNELARTVTFGDCAFEKAEAYTNEAFTGEIVHWRCPTGTRWIVVAATPTKSRDYALLIQTKLVSEADVAAYNRILSTFEARL
jgi:hypothetical protein